MNISQTKFEDIKINVKLKLASLWTSVMFLIIYIDYFHLYMPGMLNDLLAGKVFVYDISQLFLCVALVSVTIPPVMIFLSLALPSKINRLTNIILGAIYIPYMLFNLVGEAWIHMYIAAVVEVVLFGFIIWFAWKWPRTTG